MNHSWEILEILGFDLIIDVFAENTSPTEIQQRRYAQQIKQPEAPLRVLLIIIGKEDHQEEYAEEIRSGNILYQIDKVLIIVITCRGFLHSTNVAIHQPTYIHCQK
jgi:hypothetical protein